MRRIDFDFDLGDVIYHVVMGFCVVLLIIVLILLPIALVYDSNTKTAIWNDGKCACGGTWEYLESVGHRTSSTYIYECDECGAHCEWSQLK